MDKDLLKSNYKKRFEDTNLSEGYFYAPGRVNLIGEHTDYNNGFVLPMAIDRRIYMYLQLRADDVINLYSIDLGSSFRTDTEKLSYNKEDNWSNYIVGVVSELKKEGFKPQGFNMVFSGDIPQGAGLSSSAALEVATVTGLSKLNNFDIEPVDKALISQRAENNFVGVDCGIMDQYISVLGIEDHALLIDCLDYDYKKVPIKDQKYQFLIIDSKVQRGLVDSEYNLRRKQCNNVVQFFNKTLDKKITSLRDIKFEELIEYKEKLNTVDYKRAFHVLSENDRVLKFSENVKEGEFNKAGRLMYYSHLSLKNDYEVSCKQLDFLVDTALKLKGVLGSRMTGAGFGGCTVNLIKKDQKDEIIDSIRTSYRGKFNKEPDFYLTKPQKGADGF